MSEKKYNSIKLWILGGACSILLMIIGFTASSMQENDRMFKRNTTHKFEIIQQDITEIKTDISGMKAKIKK